MNDKQSFDSKEEKEEYGEKYNGTRLGWRFRIKIYCGKLNSKAIQVRVSNINKVTSVPIWVRLKVKQSNERNNSINTK